MSKERQYIAPRLSLFDQEWVVFLSSGAFRALFCLMRRAKAESSQKDPGKCPRLSNRVAAHEWRVTPEEVAEMEAAAIEAGFLLVVDGSWDLLDKTIFQAERTIQRKTAWEAENAPVSPEDGDKSDEQPTEAPFDDVCPTNEVFVGQTLSMRVESRELPTPTQLGNPIDPPDGGALRKKPFNEARFTDWFEKTFKPAYPRRRGGYEWPVAKDKLRAFFKARVVSPECVMAGLAEYRASAERDGQVGTEIVKMASTWVNKKGWLDEYDHGNGAPNTPTGPTLTPDEIAAEEARQEELLSR